MIDIKKKEEIWQHVSNEFPADPMMRDLHFIRELMDTIERNSNRPLTLKEIALSVREELIEWLRLHPEFQSRNI